MKAVQLQSTNGMLPTQGACVGLLDGIYDYNGQVWAVSFGLSYQVMGAILAPDVEDKQFKGPEDESMSQPEFILKAMAIARGDKLDDVALLE